MIPSAEMDELHADAGAAVMLAVAGEAEGGLEVLRAGLERARQLDTSWATALVACYERAVEGYCRRYRPLPGPRKDALPPVEVPQASMLGGFGSTF